MIAGIVLVVIGSIFLIRQFHLLPWWFSFVKLWPLALILPGVAILVSAGKRSYTEPPAAAPKPEEPVADPADNQPVN